MARTRMLHPEFFANADLYDAEQATGLPLRLAFAGLWCAADRAGRFAWKPRVLKVACLPHDPLDFAAVLQALVAHGFIRRYGPTGEFGDIPAFLRWQHPHPREAASLLPAYTDAKDCPEHDLGPSKAMPRRGRGKTKVRLRHDQGHAEPGVSTSDSDSDSTSDSDVPPPMAAGSTTPAGSAPTTALMRRARPAKLARSGEVVRANVATVLAELATDGIAKVQAQQVRRLAGEMAFLYWQHTYGHPNSLLDEKRLSVVLRRLDENGGRLDELLYALDGAQRDDYVMGQGRHTEHGKRDAVEFILRDRSAVEMHAGRMKGHRDGVPHPRARKLAEAMAAPPAEPEPEAVGAA